jgi:hypothetical protein
MGGSGGGMSYDLLWTNSNPSSKFDAQTVSIDLSAYSKVVVEYQMSNMYSDIGSQHQKEIFDIGENRTVYGAFKFDGNWGYSTRRSISVTTNGVIFGQGYWNGSGDAGRQNVPLYIYGIK